MSNNTYTWKFPALEVYKQQGDETNVVYNVHWRYQAETGSFSVDTFGVTGLQPYVSGSTFIPFENLTEEIVTTWVEAALGPVEILNMQQNLDIKLEEVINPSTDILPPPWPGPQPTPPPSPTPMVTPIFPPPTPSLPV